MEVSMTRGVRYRRVKARVLKDGWYSGPRLGPEGSLEESGRVVGIDGKGRRSSRQGVQSLYGRARGLIPGLGMVLEEGGGNEGVDIYNTGDSFGKIPQKGQNGEVCPGRLDEMTTRVADVTSSLLTRHNGRLEDVAR